MKRSKQIFHRTFSKCTVIYWYAAENKQLHISGNKETKIPSTNKILKKKVPRIVIVAKHIGKYYKLGQDLLKPYYILRLEKKYFYPSFLLVCLLPIIHHFFICLIFTLSPRRTSLTFLHLNLGFNIHLTIHGKFIGPSI
jgi:hypothetical protein